MSIFSPTRTIGGTKYAVSQRRNYLGQDYILVASITAGGMASLGAPEDDDVYVLSQGRLYRYLNGAWTDFYPTGSGAPGKDGASAYEVAVANGFIGSQTQWLASLQGAPGKDGLQGNVGATGDAGAVGPANILTIGTVNTLAAGSSATATITGTSPNQVLSLGIPRGATGDQGALTIGTVTALAAGSTPTATITNNQLNLGLPQGLSAPAYNYTAPALNTAGQISTTRDAQVSYNVDVAITSLLTATTGTVYLEYADNAAMTTNLVTVASGLNSVGGVLNITNTATVTLVGRIPSGKYRRIRTQVVSGSPTFTMRQAQEILL